MPAKGKGFSRLRRILLLLDPRCFVIPAQAGIQQNKTSGEADKTALLNRYAVHYLIVWISACAGMTQF
jgi:hypothetical protein